jgi:hypothetical protein
MCAHTGYSFSVYYRKKNECRKSQDESQSSFGLGKKKEERKDKQNGRRRIYIACSLSNRYSRLDWILLSFVCLKKNEKIIRGLFQ